MKTSVIGYPRIGLYRELKYAVEAYLNNSSQEKQLMQIASQLREKNWQVQIDKGVDFIPSNDFSLYDQVLDTAVLLNAIPDRYQSLDLSTLDTYFAMARGYQGNRGDVKALPLKKWFNTNYHYLVPELDDNTNIILNVSKPHSEFIEAKQYGLITKPVFIGPYTFLKLSKTSGRKSAEDFRIDLAAAYIELIRRFEASGALWIQFDEPALVVDSTDRDCQLFSAIYRDVLSKKGNTQILIQTYFGDIRDCYETVMELPFDGVGMDFVEGKQSLSLIEEHGFPDRKILFAGVVNGKNIWRNHYSETLSLLSHLSGFCRNTVISTSCSLLHVPYSRDHETQLPESVRRYWAFAEEKLGELADLKQIISEDHFMDNECLRQNKAIFNEQRACQNINVQSAVSQLSEDEFFRKPDCNVRRMIQKKRLKLPLLPTTTIGSFPQTNDIKKRRSAYKKGLINANQYADFIRSKISECIEIQEKIGFDILVHGEFERNDMAEYFAQKLDGFLFTTNGWVQSYGTRCVKPPIIWGDVSRPQPMTVAETAYAQSLSQKPVKGILTGPVTLLNWSFVREDIPLRTIALQIALAIRSEVVDLETAGTAIIQIDEAAFREKLPLRKIDWYSPYLEWAIPAFKLVHSGVKPETQIHTHMCYSEFGDIINEIEQMDADVFTFEASRSDLSIIQVINDCHFQSQVGPGLYDIHSPRVPGIDEMKETLRQILAKIPIDRVWVNPDCGLKTRAQEETILSLQNMVTAAQEVRRRYQNENSGAF